VPICEIRETTQGRRFEQLAYRGAAERTETENDAFRKSPALDFIPELQRLDLIGEPHLSPAFRQENLVALRESSKLKLEPEAARLSEDSY
jgi:hypothetical protein